MRQCKVARFQVESEDGKPVDTAFDGRKHSENKKANPDFAAVSSGLFFSEMRKALSPAAQVAV